MKVVSKVLNTLTKRVLILLLAVATVPVAGFAMPEIANRVFLVNFLVQHKAVLNWGASSGATGYNIYSSNTSGGPYQKLATVTATSFTDATVTSGSTYYYVITAFNSVSESGHSNEVKAVIPLP